MRLGKVASTTTVTCRGEYCPAVAMLEPSTTTWEIFIAACIQPNGRGTPADAPLRCRAMTDPSIEVTDLLQHLIRNACVNDGTRESGNEVRSADLLADYFDGCGLDMQRYEPAPG